MKLLDRIHERFVFGRRVARLTGLLCAMLPPRASVLDIGCGDGTIDALILQRRPDLTIRGTDVLVRPTTAIPVEPFDGVTLPFAADSFDVAMFVDVLHHTPDPKQLLREAKRVSRSAIVLKDHNRDGVLADATLSWMDDIGNARYGVALPHNYLTSGEWSRTFDELDLTVEAAERKLHLYPLPADWLFGRGLHFVARLVKPQRQTARTHGPG